jgi:hypothetical protein
VYRGDDTFLTDEDTDHHSTGPVAVEESLLKFKIPTGCLIDAFMFSRRILFLHFHPARSKSPTILSVVFIPDWNLFDQRADGSIALDN